MANVHTLGSEKILNIQLVKFQLFYLLVKWFPNPQLLWVARYFEGISVVKRLSQCSLKHRFSILKGIQKAGGIVSKLNFNHVLSAELLLIISPERANCRQIMRSSVFLQMSFLFFKQFLKLYTALAKLQNNQERGSFVNKNKLHLNNRQTFPTISSFSHSLVIIEQKKMFYVVVLIFCFCFYLSNAS